MLLFVPTLEGIPGRMLRNVIFQLGWVERGWGWGGGGHRKRVPESSRIYASTADWLAKPPPRANERLLRLRRS